MDKSDEVFILDTNIIQYLLNKNSSIAFINFFTDLNKQGRTNHYFQYL